MSDMLESATRELEQVYPGLEEIVRVDVDAAGVLQLTANGPSGTRWFTHDDCGLIERFPELDPLLPLAARLQSERGWRVLSFRPGRRMVVVYRRGELVNVIKGHKKSRSARAAVNQGIAEGATRRGAFRVPRLLSHDGQHEALVFEHLDVREVELVSANVSIYHRLGEQLAVFQEDASAQELKLFAAREELGVLDLWARKVTQAVGALPAGWPEARVKLEQRVLELPPPRLGLAHRDLHDRQIHLAGETLTLLDFDLLCRADVALDAGNLFAHLAWRAIQGLHGAEPASSQALQAAFLDGLGRVHEPGFGARLSFYTASAFLRLALVYRLRPRWRSQVTELVSRAASTLDELATLH